MTVLCIQNVILTFTRLLDLSQWTQLVEVEFPALMKFGMQAGDFLLYCYCILLSGNNYAKVALLFKFMIIGMVNKNTAIENFNLVFW